MRFDAAAMIWVAQRRHPALTRFFRTISITGEGRTWFLVALACNALRFAGVHSWVSQVSWLRALLAPLAAWLLGIVIKRAVGRQRPARSEDDIRLLGATPRDGSFPSSHASTSTAFAVALALAPHPLALPVAIWAVFVSASRIYLGVHYPTDVAAGIGIGALLGALLGHFAFVV